MRVSTLAAALRQDCHEAKVVLRRLLRILGGGKVIAGVQALAAVRCPGEAERNRIKGNCPSEWYEAVKRMLTSVDAANRRAAQTPWERKCDALLISLRLRGRMLHAPKHRVRSAEFRTADWDSAIQRMQQQGLARIRRFVQDVWVTWGYNVAKNQNRRWEGLQHARQGENRYDQGA